MGVRRAAGRREGAGRTGLTCGLVAAAVLGLSGCGGIAGEPDAVAGPTPTVATAAPTAGQVTLSTPAPSSRLSPGRPTSAPTPEIDTRTLPPTGRLDPAALTEALAPVRARYGDSLAVAWGPVGDPSAVRAVGATRDIEGWSTMKVPIAVAVSQQADGEPSGAQLRQLQQSLTVSDNDAAIAMWDSLSDPVAQVRAVLRAAGDERTVPLRGQDGRTTSFGLTAWRVDDSARYATGLPCSDDADPVLEALGRITPEHQWGLGTVADARFKGGWGISPHGYLARQLGVVPRRDGSQVAIALAAQPQAGTHEAATAAISEATKVLVSLLGEDDGGRCPSRSTPS